MQNKNTPAEGLNSTKLEAESALRDAACSPIDSIVLPVMRDEDGDEYVMHPKRGKIIRTAAMDRHKLNFRPLKPQGSLTAPNHQKTPEMKARHNA